MVVPSKGQDRSLRLGPVVLPQRSSPDLVNGKASSHHPILIRLRIVLVKVVSSNKISKLLGITGISRIAVFL